MIKLTEALVKCNNENCMENFLIDLLTPGERKALEERWEIVQYLAEEQKKSYQKISEATGASTTTITRVARFFNDEKYGGYREILKMFDLWKQS